MGEAREPFDADAQQGSSAMPHKRNTELSERVRGLARRVRSAASEELDSAVLWLERDISHSSTERFTFPDAFGALAYMARLTRRVVEGLDVDVARMAANVDATHGAVYGARLLNALLDKGAYSRTEAYDIVKALAQRALDQSTALRDLVLADERITAHLSKAEIEAAFDPALALERAGEAFRRLDLSPPRPPAN